MHIVVAMIHTKIFVFYQDNTLSNHFTQDIIIEHWNQIVSDYIQLLEITLRRSILWQSKGNYVQYWTEIKAIVECHLT